MFEIWKLILNTFKSIWNQFRKKLKKYSVTGLYKHSPLFFDDCNLSIVEPKMTKINHSNFRSHPWRQQSMVIAAAKIFRKAEFGMVGVEKPQLPIKRRSGEPILQAWKLQSNHSLQTKSCKILHVWTFKRAQAGFYASVLTIFFLQVEEGSAFLFPLQSHDLYL